LGLRETTKEAIGGDELWVGDDLLALFAAPYEGHEREGGSQKADE
jgi:hypothetical protein